MPNDLYTNFYHCRDSLCLAIKLLILYNTYTEIFDQLPQILICGLQKGLNDDIVLVENCMVLILVNTQGSAFRIYS